MTSGTLRSRQPPPVAAEPTGTMARALARAARRIENGLRSRFRTPGRDEMASAMHDDDAALFRRHVEEARPLKDRGERVGPVRRRPRSSPRHSAPEEHHSAAGGLAADPMEWVERGSRIEFARPGLQRRELRRLRRGHHPVQDRLDLHGMYAAEAERAVLEFIDRAPRARASLRVHHPRQGRSSANRRPVLKAVVDRWLRRCDAVLAFCPAPANAGGTGAVHVLLRAGTP